MIPLPMIVFREGDTRAMESASPRIYRGLEELAYPFQDVTITV